MNIEQPFFCFTTLFHVPASKFNVPIVQYTVYTLTEPVRESPLTSAAIYLLTDCTNINSILYEMISLRSSSQRMCSVFAFLCAIVYLPSALKSIYMQNHLACVRIVSLVCHQSFSTVMEGWNSKRKFLEKKNCLESIVTHRYSLCKCHIDWCV